MEDAFNRPPDDSAPPRSDESGPPPALLCSAPPSHASVLFTQGENNKSLSANVAVMGMWPDNEDEMLKFQMGIKLDQKERFFFFLFFVRVNLRFES